MRRAKEDSRPLAAAEEYVNTWTAMVIAYPDGWNTHGAHSIKKPAMDVLRSTADTLDYYVPTFESQGPDHLGNFLTILEERLKGDDSYLAQHAKRIIAHLRKLLVDWDLFGEFRIADALFDLQRILDALADQQPKDPFWQRARAGAWAWFKKDVVLAITTATAINVLTAGAADVKELVQDEMREITQQSETADQPEDGASEPGEQNPQEPDQ